MNDLLVDVLAVHRLTRLVTADTLTQVPRDRIIEAAYRRAGRWEEGNDMRPGAFEEPDPGDWQQVVEGDPLPPKLATLVTCRWCASVHVALVVVFLRWRFPRFWNPVARALALSSGSVLVARLED